MYLLNLKVNSDISLLHAHAFCHEYYQKKNRYKKMIRQHVDLQIVSSKLSNGLISSPKELLRDLLLLANNALVFYPKNSPEYNSAIILRNFACKTLKRILSASSSLDPHLSLNEEVEPEKPQIKEDLENVEEEKKEFEKEELEKKEFEKKELGNKELEKKELEKKQLGKKELEKKGLEKKELGKKELEKKELGKKELGKKQLRKREFDKEVPNKPQINTKNANFVKKKTVDRPARAGGGQRAGTNRGRKRARR